MFHFGSGIKAGGGVFILLPVTGKTSPTRPFQENAMKQTLSACLLSLATMLPAAAGAADMLATFQDGIGVQPLRAGALPNTVHGVNPGGFPWVISRLRADVGTDGRIQVDGRGLLLAGGDNIGTTGGQSVRARLFCAGVASDSDLVALDARGDFRIDGFLNPFPPSPCNTPALLIVNSGGAWFAAGIPKQ
jgi:hypothetical protein